MQNNIHQQKINKLKQVISCSMPEATLLTFARYGDQPKKQPNFTDFEAIVSSINAAEPRIIFPWFWKHNDVSRFREQFVNQIDQSRLTKIIFETCSIIDFEKSHWIERVNLFHLFGVSRLFTQADEELLKLQEKIYSGLIGVSAINAKLLAKGADTKDAVMIINKLSTENLKHTFAEYQIYYYDGFDNLIQVLSSYIGTSKEVLIPATVNSIINCFSLSKQYTNLLKDTLVDQLPETAKVLALE